MNMRKKSLISLLVLLITVSMVLGCASKEPANKETPKDTGAAKLTINFPTATTTGTIYPLGAAMANMWNNKIPNVKVNAQASNGGVHNLNLMKEGSAQISFVTTGILWEALNGEGAFKDRPYKDDRIIAGLYYNPNQFVVREAAGLKSIADIKGKRYAPGASGSTPEVESRILLTQYGLKYPDDIRPSFVGFTEAIDLMRNKQIDGALIMAGIPTAAVTEMTSTAGGKLLSIEPQIIKALQEKYPWYAEFTIPAGTYDNQKEDVKTTAIKMVLIADAKVPDETVYNLMKTLWENLEEIKPVHKIVEQIKLEGAVTDLSGIPLHPGAEKYYKEKGLIK